jgi:hypothetical protein
VGEGEAVSEPSKYGQLYWRIVLPESVSGDGVIYAYADEVVVGKGGELSLESDSGKAKRLILAPGQWIACYAASCIDGEAVAVCDYSGRAP